MHVGDVGRQVLNYRLTPWGCSWCKGDREGGCLDGSTDNTANTANTAGRVLLDKRPHARQSHGVKIHLHFHMCYVVHAVLFELRMS